MTEEPQENITGGMPILPPIKLAFIIDNEVVDVLHTDDRLSAIFLSNPVVMNVTEKIAENPQSVIPGMFYNAETNEYYIPEQGNNDV